MKFSVTTLAVVAACAGSAIGLTPASAQRTPSAGMANPASAYCQRIGGRSIVRNTSAGEAGYCRLRNGRTVDEWKLFRNANKSRSGRRGAVATTGAANPASAYCEEQGGLIKARLTEAGETAFCHLPGGRVIEEWEFFRQSTDR